MESDLLPVVHPGQILLEEFLKPLGISQNQLARAMNITPMRINEICRGHRAITADTALRLAQVLGTSSGFWITLQADHDLEVARRAAGERIAELPRLVPRAA